MLLVSDRRGKNSSAKGVVVLTNSSKAEELGRLSVFSQMCFVCRIHDPASIFFAFLQTFVFAPNQILTGRKKEQIYAQSVK